MIAVKNRDTITVKTEIRLGVVCGSCGSHLEFGREDIHDDHVRCPICGNLIRAQVYAPEVQVTREVVARKNGVRIDLDHYHRG